MQSKRLLAFLVLASFSRADYYIDDQNYTPLVYSENTGGHNWEAFVEGGEALSFKFHNGSTLTVDASHCYNSTLGSDAPCSIADDCRVQIPFNGSGITIYVLQAGFVGINASLTIDGGATTYNVLPAPPYPLFYISNVTLFSAQGMTTGNHTASMTVLNWGNTTGGMMFDYALINQTVVSPTTMSASSVVSSTATPTTPTMSTGAPTSTVTSSSSNSSTNIGAIIGGVVGGLTAFVVLLLVFFYIYRRRYEGHEVTAEVVSEQGIVPFVSAEQLSQSQGTSEWYTGITERSTSENLETSPTSPRRHKIQQGVINQGTGQIAGPSVTSLMQTGSPGTSSLSEIPRHRIQQTHPALTDDQADLVTRLHANNVPAAAIARVIERMMAEEQQFVVDEFGSLPPPSYYRGTGDE